MARFGAKVAGVALLFCAAQVCLGQNPPPQRAVLANGLTVIVAEDHRAPVVALRAYVRTGSIHEGKWLGCGISHFVEHTLDEGTTKRSGAQIETIVEAIGNASNAYTTRDHTCYYITAAREYFDQALDVLADYLMHPTFPADAVEAQRGVILNEFNMGYDDPQRVLQNLLYETMFRVHPARVPIIGYEEKFRGLKREDLVQYYRARYVPQNVIFVAAGDFDGEQALEKIARAFESWPAGAPEASIVPKEPAQTRLRRATVRKEVNVEYAALGFHTVPLTHPDLFALDVLANVLGGGRSSRLYRRLHDELRLVHAIEAYSYTPGYDGGVFGVYFVLDPENHAAAERAIFREIEKLKRKPPSAEELARAKRQIVAQFALAQESVEGRAAQLGLDELSAGDFRFSERYVREIRKVSAEQVMRAAQTYLRRSNCTIAAVVPQGFSGAVNTGLSLRGQAGKRAAGVRRTILDNGIVLLTKRNPGCPTVSVVAAALGGVRYETEENSGIFRLMSEMLTRGTATRTAQEIAEEIERLGGTLRGFSGNNSCGLEMSLLAEDFEHGLAIFADCLANATFPEEELELARRDQLAAIARARDDWESYGHDLLRAALYSAHPYRLSPLGSEKSVRAITREQLVALYRRTFSATGLVVAVFGDIAHERAVAAVKRALGGLAQGPRQAPEVPREPERTAPVLRKATWPGAQAVVFMGSVCGPVSAEDRYAVDVLDAVLSGVGLPGGRLHRRLRQSKLVYVVHAFSVRGPDTGYFAIYAACAPENVERVLGVINEELERVRRELVPEKELERGKRMCISAHALAQQTNLAQAQEYLFDELYGLGWRAAEEYAQKVGKVTAEDVRQAARKYLDPKRRATVILTPPQRR